MTTRRNLKVRSGKTQKSTVVNSVRRCTSRTRSKCRTATRCVTDARRDGSLQAMALDGLIYDWNTAGDFIFPATGKVTLDDKTLRDGLQNPSVHNPSIEEKIEILHLMESLGIEMANIGLPAARPLAYAEREALAKEIAGAKMKIRPNCAARTHENDIRPVAEISQRAGIAVEAGMFLG